MTFDISPLDKEVALSGLMKRNYWYYTILSIGLLIVFSFCLFLITLWNNIWIIVLNALLFWFLRLQVGFIAHDLSHMQVFQSKWKNRFFASIVWAIFWWASSAWWESYHNAHHKNTNQIGGDPDLDIPFLFDTRQVSWAWFFTKTFILPFQHILFIPWLCTTYLYKFVQCFYRVEKHISTKTIIETILVLISISGLYIFVSSYLSLSSTFLFFILHLLVFWFYMGVAFLPNHFWETIIEKGALYERYYQIITSRNIYGKSITNFMLGGLNFQIEHHLYPTMPRIHLVKAQKMVKNFCAKENIPYHEVSTIKSFLEMLSSLKVLTKNYKA